MRDFTPEEKELIINTPITIGCFEKWNDYHYEQVRLENFPHPALKKGKTCTAIFYPTTIMESHINCCEEVRIKYLETKNEHYFDILIHLLPNSYKVVKLSFVADHTREAIESQLTEKDKQIERLNNFIDEQRTTIARQIVELTEKDKQIEELQEVRAKQAKLLNQDTERIMALEAQIEKMKCFLDEYLSWYKSNSCSINELATEAEEILNELKE